MIGSIMKKNIYHCFLELIQVQHGFKKQYFDIMLDFPSNTHFLSVDRKKTIIHSDDDGCFYPNNQDNDNDHGIDFVHFIEMKDDDYDNRKGNGVPKNSKKVTIIK